MANSWTAAARRELLGLRRGGGAWGYRQGVTPSVEPTALACFGLLASTEGTVVDDEVRPALDWLGSIQGKDGSVGIAPGVPAPGWTTAYALLLWTATAGHDAPRRRAAAWLLQQAGKTIPPTSDPEHIIGHNTMLVGWPWVAGTHSWLEPTALAILALRRQGFGNHPRVREGLRLIRDRAIGDGGWNYGNKAAFGRELRPQPAPTGLALLTLASAGDDRSPMIERAIKYLLTAVPETRAASSVGWGVLGLKAWGQTPPDADRWLAESATSVAGRPDAAPRLGILLLAAGPHSGGVFDVRM